MIRLVIEPAARADVREAIRHYNLRGKGLGARFRERLHEALEIIQRHPGAYAEREMGVRWAMLRQFPFKVYYFTAAETAHVVAVIHAHAHPGSWLPRVGLPGPDDE